MVALLKSWFGYTDAVIVPKPKEAQHRVGEYYADYSPLTEEEIARPDPVSAELFRHTKPVSH